jgi:hypothetical protein
MATAAQAQGCSRATAHKWLRRFDGKGVGGLHDPSSRPHQSPRRLAPDRELAILNLDRYLEGPHRIGWALGEARTRAPYEHVSTYKKVYTLATTSFTPRSMTAHGSPRSKDTPTSASRPLPALSLAPPSGMQALASTSSEL